jgi:ubiquinone/menaquinone biosynthesis C-methylase UbiE
MSKLSKGSTKLLTHYFDDMARVMMESHRVLKSGGNMIIVVCPSHIRKLRVPTDKLLVELGKALGFRLSKHHERMIDPSRRLLPFQKKSFGPRMDKEYVLVLRKP